MQVLHGLTGVLAAVRHDTEAVGEAELLRELRNDGEDVTDERGLLLAQLCGRGDVGLRNNKEMLRCQRLDVIKRQALLVLIQLLRGDLACQNAAENAVVHIFPPRFTPDAW